jgi:hypothetical protein
MANQPNSRPSNQSSPKAGVITSGTGWSLRMMNPSDNPLIRDHSLTQDAIETRCIFQTSNSKVALQPVAALA